MIDALEQAREREREFRHFIAVLASKKYDELERPAAVPTPPAKVDHYKVGQPVADPALTTLVAQPNGLKRAIVATTSCTRVTVAQLSGYVSPFQVYDSSGNNLLATVAARSSYTFTGSFGAGDTVGYLLLVPSGAGALARTAGLLFMDAASLQVMLAWTDAPCLDDENNSTKPFEFLISQS